MKILVGAWAFLGALAVGRALLALGQAVFEPSLDADWVDFGIGMLVVAALHLVSLRALVRRARRARVIIGVASVLLLHGYASLLMTPAGYAGAGRVGEDDDGLTPAVLVVSLGLMLWRLRSWDGHPAS